MGTRFSRLSQIQTLLVTVALAAILASALGYFWFQVQSRAAREHTLRELSLIAEFKAGQIANWLGERRQDARLLADNPRFGADLVAMAAAKEAPKASQLARTLWSMQQVFAYHSGFVLDTAGRVILTVGSAPEAGSVPAGLARQAIERAEILWGPLRRLHSGEGAPAILDLAVPMVDTIGAAPVGAVVLRIDASRYLFPLIQSWPRTGETGEFVLARREAEDALHLNELRPHAGARPAMRVPLADRSRLLVQAVLAPGGPVEGSDYRGVPVIGSSRAIDATDWILVAKSDRAAYLAPVRKEALFAGGFLFVLFAGAGGLFATHWTRQRADYEQRLRLARLEREALARHMDFGIKYARDIVLLVDESLQVTECNDAALAAYGYTRDEMLGRNVALLRAPETRESVADDYRRSAAPRGHHFEAVARRKDGSTFPVEVSTRLIEIDGGRFYQAIARDITERVRADRELRESEECFRATFEQAAVGIAHVAPDGRFVRVNRKLCDIVGYSRDELLARTFQAISHPDDLAADQAALGRLLAGELPTYAIEKRYLRKDGGILWVNVTVSLVRDRAGRPEHFISVVEDITPRKAAERRIGHLTRMYATLSHTNQAIVRARSEEALFADICNVAVEHGGLHGALVRIADAEAKLLRPAAYAGELASVAANLVVSTDPALPESRGLVALAYREDRIGIENDLTADHAGRPWRVVAHAAGIRAVAALPLRRGGKPVGTYALYAQEPGFFDPEMMTLLEELANNIGYVLDNLDYERRRKRAERGLAESEQRFRALVEQSIAGIGMVQDGRITYVNPRYAEIFGYSAEEMLGEPVTRFIAEEDRARVAENLRKRIEGETRSMQYTFTGLRKDGSRITVGVHGAIASVDGRPAVIGMLQDISERERAQQQIRDYIKQLESSMRGTVQAVSAMLDLRDPYTAGHERRVSVLARAIGAEMGLAEDRLEGLEMTGLVHDIGKIAVPAEILSKPGRLSAIEFSLIQAHPQAGYDILKDVEFPWPLATAIRQHHERLDGTGYPQGLKGEQIILEARILAVADVVEAMGSHRPYRATLGIEAALQEIASFRGIRYDATVADACLRLFHQKGYVLPA